MRKTASYLGAISATHEVLGAYDGKGFVTDDEATTNNRKVVYEVLCKSCAHKHKVTKQTLASGSNCPVCKAVHPPMGQNQRQDTTHPLLRGPWTLFVTDKAAYVVKGAIQNAISRLPRSAYDEWLKSGQVSQGVMLLDAPLVAFNAIMPEGLTRGTTLEAVEYDEPPPQPKASGPTNLTEAQLKMLSLYEGHGTVSEEMQADLAFLTPPTAKDFCLMPRKVWDRYDNRANFLAKHGYDIPEGATTSLAWDVPPWVWVYPPVLNEPELPAWD